MFRRILGAVESAGIPYKLTGSFASSYHGAPRPTQDIDLAIAPARAQLRGLAILLWRSSNGQNRARARARSRMRRVFCAPGPPSWTRATWSAGSESSGSSGSGRRRVGPPWDSAGALAATTRLVPGRRAFTFRDRGGAGVSGWLPQGASVAATPLNRRWSLNACVAATVAPEGSDPVAPAPGGTRSWRSASGSASA